MCLPLIQIINREQNGCDDQRITQAVKTISTLIADPKLIPI